MLWKKMIWFLGLAVLVGCADPQVDDDAVAAQDDELGLVHNALEKVVYRSVNAGDPPAIYYGAGNIEVRLTNGSVHGAALEIRNKSGTTVTIPYAKITVTCEDGAGDWTNEFNPDPLKGGEYWGEVQLCYSKLLSASIEVKLVRP